MADPTLTIRIVEEGGKQQLVASGPLSPEEQAQLQELGLPVTSPEGKTRRQKAGHESPEERESRREREHNLAVDRRKAERDSRHAERDQAKASRSSAQEEDEYLSGTSVKSILDKQDRIDRIKSRRRKHRTKRANIARLRARRNRIGNIVGSTVGSLVTQATRNPLLGSLAGYGAARSAAVGGIGLAAGVVAGVGLAASATIAGGFALANQGVSSVQDLSGPVIAAQAMNQVKLLEAMLDRANRIGAELGKFSAAQGKFEAEKERLLTQFMAAALPVVTPLLEFATLAIQKLRELLGDDEAGDDWNEMMRDAINRFENPILFKKVAEGPQQFGFEQDRNPNF